MRCGADGLTLDQKQTRQVESQPAVQVGRVQQDSPHPKAFPVSNCEGHNVQ